MCITEVVTALIRMWAFTVLYVLLSNNLCGPQVKHINTSHIRTDKDI